MSNNLTNKYNVPGPRYTSYPTVPYWDANTFSYKGWISSFQKAFRESNHTEGISLYIHLPFCESLCTFCGCHKRITKRHEVEQPYINAVIKEWKLYCAYLSSTPKIKELHLGGGTPTFFSPENLEQLLDGIFKYAERAPGYDYSFEGHPNNTTKAHLEVLFKYGFTRVSFGVQDYNSTVQKAINRFQPFENVKEVTEQAREVGFTSVGHDLVFGLPFQTIDNIHLTIENTKKLMPDRIAFYSYAHVPWIKGNGQRGFGKENLPSGEEKRTLYETGKEKLAKLGYHEIGMDHFALPTDSLYQAASSNIMHRNFMGYTHSKTQLMIGLGVSSISDSWYGFAQNVKNIEEYYHLLDNNIIPVYRGHLLSDEDLIIRKHILNLMCTFTTSWLAKEQQFSQLENTLQLLKEMEADKLLEIHPDKLIVTESGKPFIRNICMAFDVKLQENKPETRIFSMTV
jgi:oxygen-independent coproporphyrinogen-3 oxidase